MKEEVKNLLMAIVVVIAIVCIGLAIFGTVNFWYRCNTWGNEYYQLALDSPDIDNAVIHLTKYKEAIEKNGFNKGSAGLVFKTADKDMSNRYLKLVQGIESLKQIQEQTELSGTDFNIYSDMKTYVESLNVGIMYHQTASNGWYCFLFLHSIWVSIIVAIAIIGIGNNIIYY